MAIMQLSCLATSNDFRPKKSQGAPCMNMNLFRLMLNSLTYGFGLIHTLPCHLHVLITTPRTPQAYTPGTVTGVRAWEDIQAYTKIIKGNK